MAPPSSSTEERLARLEVHHRHGETDLSEVKDRLAKIEDAINELSVTMRSAKITGRIFLGIAAAVGSVIGWFLSVKG